MAGFTDVEISSSRIFPDLANEGATTLAALGVTQLQIWGCGGGGGGVSLNTSSGGGGGGSGSAVDGFFVDNAASLFVDFNCTLALGGAGGTFVVPATDGGITSIIGTPVVPGEAALRLFAYGGGAAVGSPGGGGGGSGGSASGTTPGIAGDEGGLAGGAGGTLLTTPDPGAFRYPWHSGAGGGKGGVLSSDDGPDWPGGGSGGVEFSRSGGGAGGQFGKGGDARVPVGESGGFCAGGGGTLGGLPNIGGDGGPGFVFIRYWTI